MIAVTRHLSAKRIGFKISVGSSHTLTPPVPDPAEIWRIISKLHLEDFDFILIEGCGGMAPLKDVGQDATAAVLAVSGGDDKALEYHTLFKSAWVILLTKMTFDIW